MLLQEGVTAKHRRVPRRPLSYSRTRASPTERSRRRATGLAWMLIASGCRREDRVGLLMPKMPTAIVAMLGGAQSRRDLRAAGPGGPPDGWPACWRQAIAAGILAAGPVSGMLREALATAAFQSSPQWMAGRRDRSRGRRRSRITLAISPPIRQRRPRSANTTPT